MASSVFILIVSWFIYSTKGNIVLQSSQHCGTNKKPLEERILDVDELTVFSHTGQQYYYPDMECIVTIIGKIYHQWEIQLTNIHIDADKDDCLHERAPCCNDYLKIFNSYRVDNARLFPSIPWRGLCGVELPRQPTFTSSQNYITIQFNANPKDDSMRGFALRLRQYPRRNSGSEISQTGYFGGWNDGTLTELQIDWSQQEQIPGDYVPGQDPTFEYDQDGVACYECTNCKRDYFKTSDIGVTVREGCFVCTKEWLQGNSQTVRQCLSRTGFSEKLRTLRDSSGNDGVTEYRGCKTFLRGVQGTTYVNLCICDTGKCNKGQSLKFKWMTTTVLMACVIYFVKYF